MSRPRRLRLRRSRARHRIRRLDALLLALVLAVLGAPVLPVTANAAPTGAATPTAEPAPAPVDPPPPPTPSAPAPLDPTPSAPAPSPSVPSGPAPGSPTPGSSGTPSTSTATVRATDIVVTGTAPARTLTAPITNGDAGGLRVVSFLRDGTAGRITAVTSALVDGKPARGEFRNDHDPATGTDIISVDLTGLPLRAGSTIVIRYTVDADDSAARWSVDTSGALSAFAMAPESAPPARAAAVAAVSGEWRSHPSAFIEATHRIDKEVLPWTSGLHNTYWIDTARTVAAPLLLSRYTYSYAQGIPWFSEYLDQYHGSSGSGKPTFRFHIPGVIDTDATGWTYSKASDGTGDIVARGPGAQPLQVRFASTGSTVTVEISRNLGTGFAPYALSVPPSSDISLRYRWNEVVTADYTPVPTRASVEVAARVITPVNPVRAPASCGTGTTVWVSSNLPNGDSRNTTQLHGQPFGATTLTPIGAPTNWVYNALAYDDKDGFLYAISHGRLPPVGGVFTEDPLYPAGHLLRISPVDGAVQDLGFVTGFRGNHGEANSTSKPNDLWVGPDSGVIDAQGRYWVSTSTGSRIQYNVNRTTRVATDGPLAAAAVDRAILPGRPDQIWGIINGTTRIERVDLASGVAMSWDLAGLRSPLGSTFQSGNYGTAWTYGNGNLGFSRDGTGEVYQIKVTDPGGANPHFQLVSVGAGPASNGNDAASNALDTPDVDLAITKELLGVDPSGQATWKVRVRNLSDCLSSGFTVTTEVPTTYSNISVSAPTSAGWVGGTTVSGNSVRVFHGRLAAGATAEFTISATPGSGAVCVENTAIVIGNEHDPAPANDTASDRRCSPTVSKDVTDVDGNGHIDWNDTAIGTGEADTFYITYTLTVRNPADGTNTTYQLSDKPDFGGVDGRLTVLRAEVTSDGPGTWPRNLTGAGPYEFAPAGTVIAPGVTHTYTLKVFYHLANSSEPPAETDTSIRCEEGKPNHGYFNRASLTTGGQTQFGDACAPIIPPGKVLMQVRNVDADGHTGPLSGASFAIHAVNPDGTIGYFIKTMGVDAAGFHNAVLFASGRDYYLVETRSPTRYQLLSRPVRFHLSLTGTAPNQHATIEIRDESPDVAVALANINPITVAVQIADVRVGDLPLTGGPGALPWALAGVVILGFGVLLGRPRFDRGTR